MKETLRRWSTYIREDKLIRRLLYAMLILVIISVSSFILKGPNGSPARSSNPADHFVHEKPGITNIKSPTMIVFCGVPLMLIEPKDDGSTTIFGGEKRIRERLNQIPEAPIIVTEISKSYQGISCDALLGDPGTGIGPSPGMLPSFPHPIPPGYKWSA